MCYNKRMKNTLARKIASAAAVSATLALCACSTPVTVLFDTERPWRAKDETNGYERLDYAVSVYDVSAGTDAQNKIKIAEGALLYTLDEGVEIRDNISYSTVDMSFSVTYNDSSAEKDRGLTDKISSRTLFQTNSLDSCEMEKTVSLAPRADTVNRSYTVSADYFGEHTAKFLYTAIEDATEQTLSIPRSTYCDNEMMFYLARATALADGASPNFYMTNMFEAFASGKLENYVMVASVNGVTSVDVGDWVKDLGVEAVTNEESGETSYPVPCFETSIMPSIERHGPPYYVFYSQNPLKQDGKEHKKVPVKIVFNEYSGSKLGKITEYVLRACDFTKA